MTEEGPGIVWENPPPRARTSPPWMKLLRPLKKHPGRWARVWEARDAKQASSIASRLRRGRTKRPAGMEFVHSDRYVYARYLGEGTTPTDASRE